MTPSPRDNVIGNRRLPSLLIAAAGAAWLALGCGHKAPPPAGAPPCKESKLEITVRASERVNPDDRGRALPTVVRVYFLKGLKMVETAGFEDVWQREKEALGEDLVGSEEFTLEPGARKVTVTARNPEASQVMVVGLFRQPKGIAWRRTRRLPPTCEEAPPSRDVVRPEVYPIRFVLEDYRIEAES
jgi:type VI secretion system protein VasD